MTHKAYHFIGIGGIGMSALAHILLERKVTVTGSDMAHSAVIEELIKKGAKISLGHTGEHLDIATKVIYTSDVTLVNPEYRRAVELGIPILHRSELLKELMLQTHPLLVAGAHGKTTTSSVLAHVLVACQLEPSFAIGGIVRGQGTNGRFGRGRYFVAEADESDGSFLSYPGFGAIITNIDNDHMNYWKTKDALLQGFAAFAEKIASKSHLFWCKDDPELNALQIKGISYGTHENADLRITGFQQKEWTTSFSFLFRKVEFKDVEIPLIGGHNVLNAAAVFGLCLALDIAEVNIRKALATFEGIGRRVEKKGERRGIAIYDDYGHHPTEIMTTLSALKKAVGDRRLVVAFQPHRYTRTRDCMEQFPTAFEAADLVFLTDIYAARELPIPGVTEQDLYQKIRERCSKEVTYCPRSHLCTSLVEALRPGDVLVTMGAGDITAVGREVLAYLHE